MARKIIGATLMFMTMLSPVLAFACSEIVPEKYLSFFSAQFIGYARLRNDLRVQRYAQLDERETPKPYYLENRSIYANLNDWLDYLQAQGMTHISLPALADVIYQLDGKTLATLFEQRDTLDKAAIARLAAQSPNVASMRNAAALIAEIAAHDRTLIEYLLFMKACYEAEIILLPGNDDEEDKDDDAPRLNDIDDPSRTWDEPPSQAVRVNIPAKRTPRVNPSALIAQGVAAYQRCDSDWLKIRYAYLVMIVARYAEQFEQVAALYDELVEPLDLRCRIRYWALEQKAGALGREGDGVALFLDVHANAPERRASVRDSLSELRLTMAEDEEPLTSPHDIARMWMEQGLAIYRRHLEPARRVYEFAPQSAFLESLLIWALLKCEEVEIAEFLEYPDHATLDLEYLAEFREFALSVANAGNVRRPALWQLAAGYLAFMESLGGQHDADADALLKQAERMAGNDLIIRHQARLLQFVVRLYQPGRINKRFLEALTSELQWLQDQGEITILQTVMTALAQKLLLQDDVPFAICCLYAANDTMIWPDSDSLEKRAIAHFALDMYATERDVERLYQFMNQASYSAFERFALSYLPLTRDELLDVWGTRLLRQHQFERALNVFKQISPTYWEEAENSCRRSWEWSDNVVCIKTFRTSFFDNTYRASKQFSRMTKLEFTQAILELEAQARRDRARAADYYWQIANAFYNTPYWGYAGTLWRGSLVHMFKYQYWSYARSDEERDYPFNAPILKEALKQRERVFRNEYGTRAFALEYYQKALRAANDDEFAAETLAMSQKCLVVPTMTSISQGHSLPVKTANYFRPLRERYATTKFHQRLIEECATYREYVRQR
ncbi:hypothetical protein, fragment [Candidatus Moduliflexus flocculans]|uniref:Uncharacterized protein n=1 Tax=Candidatus Moduliflexus flocculans TaxID=1499966 RepID=A0A0S6W4J5_9BACT|nr:hypothetical protein, fragment [Candidatus Moduliflexus flocculans]